MSTTAEEIYRDLQTKLGDVLPDAELLLKAEVAAEVLQLKTERDAVILGHNYMEPALFHTVPDFQGDSLELSRRAAETDKSVIVFCGVRFMAETAKILNPSKTVLLPTERGGCSLAESITAADVRALRAAYPGVPIVTYINTYADVKAECDICCTSSNAAAVVESLKSDTVIFLPDEYLARNVARETGRHIIVPSVMRKPGGNGGAQPDDTTVEHVMIGWKGRCEVHELFTPQDVDDVRKQFPDVFILAHPECSPEVTAKADFSGSTTAMIKAVRLRTTSDTQPASHQLGEASSVAAKGREVIATTSPRAWLKPTAPFTSCSRFWISRMSRGLPSGLRRATATLRRRTVPVCARVTETSRPTAKVRL